MMHTTTYKEWEVVVVPFPFTDSTKSKSRPALVLSNHKFNTQNQHTVMAMITTATKSKWWNDNEIKDLSDTGLTVKSFVRMKIFSLDNRLIKRKIGVLSKKDKESCMKSLKNSFDF